MATANVLDQLESDFLSCVICHETFSDPRVLNCLHSFCCACLTNYAERNAGFVQNPCCPICQTPFQIPENGVDGLQGNFFIAGICETLSAYNKSTKEDAKIVCSSCDKEDVDQSTTYCLQCGGFLCGDCGRHHQRMKATKEHQLLGREEMKDGRSWVKSRSKAVCTCKKHNGEMMKLFCKECKVPVCVLCSLQDHKGHDFMDVADAGEESRDDVVAVMTVAEEKVSAIQFCIDEARQVRQKLKEGQSKVLAEIDERAEQLIESLTKQVKDQAEKLKRETKERYSRKDEMVTGYENILEEDIKGASNACDYARKVVRYGNNVELVSMKNQVCSKLQSVSDSQVEQLQTTGSIQLTAAESQPVVRASDIGRIVWKMGGPKLAFDMHVGDRVERSTDWCWGNQDGGLDCKGTVDSNLDDGLWIGVQWDSGERYTYRMGCNGVYDLELADEKSSERPRRVGSESKGNESQGWVYWMMGWRQPSEEN